MTKKIYVIAAIAVLAVLAAFGAASEAGVMKFEHFSIDVPKGWTVDEDKEASTVAFIAPDESAAFTVTIIENAGLPLEEYAKLFQNELKGKNLQDMDDGYAFGFNAENGVDAKAIVTGDEKMILFMTIIGGHNDMGGLVSSIKAN